MAFAVSGLLSCQNHSPEILGGGAPDFLEPGKSTVLSMVVRDLDRDPLTVEWSAPFGEFEVAESQPFSRKGDTSYFHVSYTAPLDVTAFPFTFRVKESGRERMRGSSGVTVGRFSDIARSLDGGRTWSSVRVPDRTFDTDECSWLWCPRTTDFRSYPEYAPIFHIIGGDDILFAGDSFPFAFGAALQPRWMDVTSLGGGLYGSVDRGGTWTQISLSDSFSVRQSLTAFAWSALDQTLYAAGTEPVFDGTDVPGETRGVYVDGVEQTGRAISLRRSRLWVYRIEVDGRLSARVVQVSAMDVGRSVIIPLGLDVSHDPPEQLLVYGVAVGQIAGIVEGAGITGSGNKRYDLELVPSIEGFALVSNDRGDTWHSVESLQESSLSLHPRECSEPVLAGFLVPGASDRMVLVCGRDLVACVDGICNRLVDVGNANTVGALGEVIWLFGGSGATIEAGAAIAPADLRALIAEKIMSASPRPVIQPIPKHGAVSLDPKDGSISIFLTGPYFEGPELQSEDGGISWQIGRGGGGRSRVVGDPVHPERALRFSGRGGRINQGFLGFPVPLGAMEILAGDEWTQELVFRNTNFGIFGGAKFYEDGTVVAGVP